MNREEAERRANNSFRLIFNLEIRCLFFAANCEKKEEEKNIERMKLFLNFLFLFLSIFKPATERDNICVNDISGPIKRN